MIPIEQRICRKCFYISKGGFDLCLSPHNGISPVTGEVQPSLAVSQRSDFRKLNGLPDTGCGPEGKYFTPIDDVPEESFWESIVKYFKSF